MFRVLIHRSLVLCIVVTAASCPCAPNLKSGLMLFLQRQSLFCHEELNYFIVFCIVIETFTLLSSSRVIVN